MNKASLLLINVLHQKLRTVLMILAIAVASSLYITLQAVNLTFTGDVKSEGIDQLIVSPRYLSPEFYTFPVKQRNEIRSIQGVSGVVPWIKVHGTYEDNNVLYLNQPVEPLVFFETFNDWTISEEVLTKFSKTRIGVVASVELEELYNWSPGDNINIVVPDWGREDRTNLWEFEYVGSVQANRSSVEPQLFFNYAYFVEAIRQFHKTRVPGWLVRVENYRDLRAIAANIDRTFKNSQHPTKSATMDDLNRDYIRRMGNVGFVVTVSISIIFFSVVIFVSTTLIQSLRERFKDLAVLGAIGFTNTYVTKMLLFESLLIWFVGCAFGVAFAVAAESYIALVFEQLYIGSYKITLSIIASAFALTLTLGTFIGIVPPVIFRRSSLPKLLNRSR